ncbi:MAG: GntR family transcriptional regulator [Clostridiaceae bacterium]|nr:GntR family transcriptional regulator [Clostridiaceae bacterium]
MALRYLEVKNEILRLIEGMKPHSRVPSRQWLCKKCGVARSTVDKAIAELIAENHLYTMKGSGTYIQEREGLATIINFGVILPFIMEAGYPKLLNGIERYASKRNINVIVCSSENTPQKQHNYVIRMIESKIDGCIIIPSINSEMNHHSFSLLEERGIPFVFCNRFVDGFNVPFLGNNNYYGEYAATKHIIDVGCKNIAYMSPRKYSTSIERYYGFMTAMLDNGMSINMDNYLHDNVPVEKLKYQAAEIFSKPDYPDGVVCFNDTMAAYLYPILADKGLAVGRDVKIIGYDDGPICENMRVPLSSVSSKAEEVGYEAAKMLMGMVTRRFEEKAGLIRLFTPELRIRKSSGQGKEGMK